MRRTTTNDFPANFWIHFVLKLPSNKPYFFVAPDFHADFRQNGPENSCHRFQQLDPLSELVVAKIGAPCRRNWFHPFLAFLAPPVPPILGSLENIGATGGANMF